MKPRTDQIRFMSSANGETILDAYIEACEKGGRSIGDLLSDLFDASGYFRSDIFEFREDPANPGFLQFRVGDFFSPGGGWVTMTYTSFAGFIDACEAQRILAETAATNAAASAASASASATSASSSKDAAAASALNAASSATAAAGSASAASASATTASTKASEASTSATNAASSASSASTSATNAASSATAASGSASAASTSATNAANSATAANTSKDAAATSASAAATSATNASTSATNASNSATNAANSATTASGHASTASTNASEASTSASNAAASATAAAGSATAAANSAIDAANAAANSLPLTGGTVSGSIRAQMFYARSNSASLNTNMILENSNGTQVGGLIYSISDDKVHVRAITDAGVTQSYIALGRTSASFQYNGNNVWHAGNFNPVDYVSVYDNRVKVTATIGANPGFELYDTFDKRRGAVYYVDADPSLGLYQYDTSGTSNINSLIMMVNPTKDLQFNGYSVATGLNIGNVYGGNVVQGAVGAIQMLAHGTVSAALAYGVNYAGSSLRLCSLHGDGTGVLPGISGTAPSGTWKSLGTITPSTGRQSISLFLRIA